MHENWDFVSMKTYSADMAESTDRAVAIITQLRKEVDQAKRTLAEVVLAAGGRVEVSSYNLCDPRRDTELTIWRNDADMTIMFTSNKRYR